MPITSPFPEQGPMFAVKVGVSLDCSPTCGISEDGRKGEEKRGTQNGKNEDAWNRY